MEIAGLEAVSMKTSHNPLRHPSKNLQTKLSPTLSGTGCGGTVCLLPNIFLDLKLNIYNV